MTSSEIESLYKQYFRQLCLYALHYLEDLDESKDIVQECFSALIKGNPEISNPKAYLYNSVRNRCIDLLRSKKKERMAPMDDLSYISDEEAQLRSEMEVQLWEAVDSLPPKRRELLLLNKRDGLKYSEIAQLKGLSENTVRNQIFRAVESLRKNAKKLFSFLFCL
ncbi:MAG: sigma-70 family RNA polymerase sigma factor [Bacteroidales bacterium]|nr:sigma-70 family RNA polymerase sigma factor [Bacteroidales bacterium]